MTTEFYLDDFSESGKQKLAQYYNCDTVEELENNTNLNTIPVFTREDVGEL